MKLIPEFAAFILENYLEAYIDESIGNVKRLDIPLLKFFTNLTDEQFRRMSSESAIKFLTSLKEETALNQAAESLRQWETDTLPGIPKSAISPADLVLVYTAQKFTIYRFICKYTSDIELGINLVRELEEYYSIIQNNAIQLLFKMQKEAEQEISKKNLQLEEAQMLAHIGSWEWHYENQKINWSDEMYRIFGMKPQEKEITADIFFSYMRSEEDSNHLLEKWTQSVKGKEFYQHEYPIKRANGEVRILHTRGHLIFDENGEIKTVYGTTQDITEIKQAEVERQISKQKDEFMSIASHELKTPLTSVKAYIELMQNTLQRNPDAQPELTTYVDKAKNNLLKLHSLIADLLDVSKIQAGKLQLDIQPLNFSEVLKECIETINHISPHHKVKVEGNPDIIVPADRRRLEQVVMNYLTNAVKYSPKFDQVNITVKTENNHLQVAVKDFGIGIPKDKQEKIFNRFYRVNDHLHTFAGLGIGLYISSEIIKRHNGKVWVESEEGKGSTFYFSLPLSN